MTACIPETVAPAFTDKLVAGPKNIGAGAVISITLTFVFRFGRDDRKRLNLSILIGTKPDVGIARKAICLHPAIVPGDRASYVDALSRETIHQRVGTAPFVNKAPLVRVNGFMAIEFRFDHETGFFLIIEFAMVVTPSESSHCDVAALVGVRRKRALTTNRQCTFQMTTFLGIDANHSSDIRAVRGMGLHGRTQLAFHKDVGGDGEHRSHGFHVVVFTCEVALVDCQVLLEKRVDLENQTKE